MRVFGRLLTLGISVSVAGCSTYKPPSPLLETHVSRILSDVERLHPREKLYRQYVSGQLYLQFERISDNNVVYGWVTCTNCNWTREKLAAVYDGSYLYLTYGHHEDFFLFPPKEKSMHPTNLAWIWNTVEKYQLEGRNLILLSKFRRCIYKSPSIEEWFVAPWVSSGEIDCRVGGDTFKEIYVATVDDTLVGSRDSIVGSERESAKERLQALEKLYRDSIITEDEYQRKRREILDDL